MRGGIDVMDIRTEMENKYGKEAYVNMDQLASFMIRMIKKYGSDILREMSDEKGCDDNNAKKQ